MRTDVLHGIGGERRPRTRPSPTRCVGESQRGNGRGGEARRIAERHHVQPMEPPNQPSPPSASATPASPSSSTVTLTEKDGRWLALAMLADEPDIGVSDEPREALRAALAALGEPWASEMAARAELPA